MRKLRLISVFTVISMSWSERGTNIRLNPTTGGYEDIAVRIGSELTPSSCSLILDNIKVTNKTL